MKHLQKLLLGTLIVLATAACSSPSQQAQVFSDYDYRNVSADVYAPAYASSENQMFRVNNLY